MNIGWGAKIAMLYGGFVLMIGILVYKSTQEDFDLVATDYYQKELDYQNVIDAGRNQAQLSRPIDIMATEHVIGFDFPPEFQGKNLNGTIKFYAPMNEEWDREFPIEGRNINYEIPADLVAKTRYLVKISWEADGVNYYQENELNMHN